MSSREMSRILYSHSLI